MTKKITYRKDGSVKSVDDYVYIKRNKEDDIKFWIKTWTLIIIFGTVLILVTWYLFN